MEEKILFLGFAHILRTHRLALLLFKLKNNALNEYCINHHGSFSFCFNSSTTLFHTKLFFHIICITNLLFYQKEEM